MPQLGRKQIAETLAQMAAIFEIKGENPFKVRAYENAARVVEGLTNLEELISEHKLTEVKGIGRNLADHIEELFKTGKIKEYERLRTSIPDGIFDMLAIPGVGPKKVKFFWEKLHVKDLGGLELVCHAGRLRKLPGFGEKTEEKILEGIAYLHRHTGQHLFASAETIALPVFSAVEKHTAVIRSSIAGSLRRRKEVIKDIDIVASSDKPAQVMDAFVSLPQVERVEARGETKSSVVLKGGINSDLRVVADKEFPFALYYLTGSKEHNIAVRARAQKMGFKLSEYGLFSAKGGSASGGKGDRFTPCKDEEGIFKKLGLAFIPPELRENMGEIEAAEKDELPRLIEEKDIKGVLHIHTNYSDGANTIEEIAFAVREMGYSYVGICDHSQSAAYAGGLKPDDIKKQHEEIDALNKKLKGIAILKGIESDILADGSLDYSSDILASFDFVVASVHSKFNMTEEEMTKRVIKAISSPYVHIFGHPTGRLLLSREGYPINLKEVISAAADHGVAIELNANPHRLDLDWRLGPYTRSKGVKIAICPDAHIIDGISDVRYGVGIARKGWFMREDVVNAWGLGELRKWLGEK